MERPHTSASYLRNCVECFLEALAEAEALALCGDTGDRLTDTLHFASDLLDIISDDVNGRESDPAAHSALDDMRDQLNAVRDTQAPGPTLH